MLKDILLVSGKKLAHLYFLQLPGNENWNPNSYIHEARILFMREFYVVASKI